MADPTRCAGHFSERGIFAWYVLVPVKNLLLGWLASRFGKREFSQDSFEIANHQECSITLYHVNGVELLLKVGGRF
jgi:hypothetical protein